MKDLKMLTLLIFISLYSLTFSFNFLERTQIEAFISNKSKQNNKPLLHFDKPPSDTFDAKALYSNTLENNGWDTLRIESRRRPNETRKDSLNRAYSFGYIEGILTRSRIYFHFQNMRHYYFHETNDIIPEETKEFLSKNHKWIEEMTEKNLNDDYWYTVALGYYQFRGVVDGYNDNSPEDERIGVEEFQVMNAFGDIGEISFWKKEKRPNFSTMSSDDLQNYIDLNNHCSVLIKILPDFKDILFGHNTWFTYSSMIRIYKEYYFEGVYDDSDKAAKTVSFSSYPGTITSVDDFYITSNDLFVTETTNQILDENLYDLLTTESLLTWIRAFTANKLAKNGKQWTEIYAKFNSGTYNNQYMILDLNKVHLDQKRLDDEALYIIEQIPGYTRAADVTDHLRNGYWASYNTPFFEDIRDRSNITAAIKDKPELADALDHEKCARANIFRRDHGKVVDLDSFKKLIRYNNYIEDPLSKNNPSFAICSRKDLIDGSLCNGGTDSKIASVRENKGRINKKAHIISGPTNDPLPIFNVGENKCNQDKYRFSGMPNFYNFDWIEFETMITN